MLDMDKLDNFIEDEEVNSSEDEEYCKPEPALNIELVNVIDQGSICLVLCAESPLADITYITYIAI